MIRTLLTIAALTISANAYSAQCQIPVGGSENSVGDGLYPLRAKSAFRKSATIKGQGDLLTRAGYCASTYLKADSLGGNKFRVTQTFKKGFNNTRTLSGEFTWSEMSDRGYFQATKLNLFGLGKEVTLDADTSDELMDAMSTAGLVPENMVMGHTTLVASALRCSTPVVPNPSASCRFTIPGETLPVDNGDTSATLDAMLRGLNAYDTQLIGAVNTTAAIVTCGRVVYPGARATCSIVVK